MKKLACLLFGTIVLLSDLSEVADAQTVSSAQPVLIVQPTVSAQPTVLPQPIAPAQSSVSAPAVTTAQSAASVAPIAPTQPVVNKKITKKKKSKPLATLHDKAVLLARNGNTAKGLEILKKLHAQYPADVSVTRDYVVVASWAAQYDETINVYKTLPAGKQPDYVLEAVAYSYRTLNKNEDALAVYRQGLNQSPNNPVFAAGLIRSYVDTNQIEKALTLAEQDLQTHGDRLEVLLAAVYATQAAKKPMDTLIYSEKAVFLYQNNKEARYDFVKAVDAVGAHQAALQLAYVSPEILSPEEYRYVQANQAASAVRWGALEPINETERYAQTDRAIAMLDALIKEWSSEGPAMNDALLRARFDRMIAYHDRNRMKDILVEYDDMRAHNIQIPLYVLGAVGDAYLYVRQPEKARDVFLKVLKENPKDFNIRIQLFYAYVELNDFKNAYQVIDELDKEQRIWIYLKGLPEPVPNPDRATADLTVGFARLYGEELAKAEAQISAVENAAPNDPRYRAALGTVYETRGLPRLAQEQYQIGIQLAHGQDVADKTGVARTDLELQHYQTADVETASLVQQFPENLEVQTLDRDWQIYNMAELRIDAEHAFRSSTSAAGGSGTAVDAEIFSRPIDYNWRVFAGELYATEAEPAQEGTINFYRTIMGVEYRNNGLTASAGPTYNVYNSNDRVGGRADVSDAINDYWTINGYGEIFSRDTPLRALNAGVTANAAGVGATYRENESRELALGTEFMNFSDGNNRTSINGVFTQRLYTIPNFKIDGIVDMAASNDTANENRLYYNPSDDLMTLVGVNFTQTLYHSYDTIYEHNLKVMPGDYVEQNYGSSFAGVVEYDQSLSINKVFKVGVGVSFARQDYDGIPENTVSILGNLNYRF